MDGHIKAHLESKLGFPLSSFPETGIDVRVSPRRTDRPRNRLVVHRIAAGAGVLATGIERMVDAVGPVLHDLSPAELFSPFGIAELRRAMPEADRDSLLEDPGMDYTISGPDGFRPAATGHATLLLTDEDIPSAVEDGWESSASLPVGLARAFVCCHGDEWVSIAIIRWEKEPVGTIAIARTEDPYLRQGYGRAAVSAATEYILRQQRVASYGTVRGNIPALRMIRPLGYRLTYETIYA